MLPRTLKPVNPVYTSASEQALLVRIRAGDKAACDECIERHAPGVQRLALRLTRDPLEAEEVTQETFLNAFKGIAGFDGRASLQTWLYRIAYNVAIGRLRRVEPETVAVQEDSEEGELVPPELFDDCCLPEKDFETAEAQAHLEQAIRALPPTLRAVFVLREINDLSTEDTAQALEVSESVVKTRLHRARHWLRDRLAPYFTEEKHSPIK